MWLTRTGVDWEQCARPNVQGLVKQLDCTRVVAFEVLRPPSMHRMSGSLDLHTISLVFYVADAPHLFLTDHFLEFTRAFSHLFRRCIL